jgi:hypothetical protein
MEKTNVNTALAIFFVATAAMVIGGLAAIPLITTAMAAKPDFQYCIRGTAGRCFDSQFSCELFRSIFDIQAHCHPFPIRAD